MPNFGRKGTTVTNPSHRGWKPCPWLPRSQSWWRHVLHEVVACARSMTHTHDLTIVHRTDRRFHSMRYALPKRTQLCNSIRRRCLIVCRVHRFDPIIPSACIRSAKVASDAIIWWRQMIASSAACSGRHRGLPPKLTLRQSVIYCLNAPPVVIWRHCRSRSTFEKFWQKLFFVRTFCMLTSRLKRHPPTRCYNVVSENMEKTPAQLHGVLVFRSAFWAINGVISSTLHHASM